MTYFQIDIAINISKFFLSFFGFKLVLIFYICKKPILITEKIICNTKVNDYRGEWVSRARFN